VAGRSNKRQSWPFGKEPVEELFQPTTSNALGVKQLSQFKSWGNTEDLLASGNELPLGGFNLTKVGRAQELREQADPERVLSQPVGLSRLHLVSCRYRQGVVFCALSSLSLGLGSPRLLAGDS
jgi:hypothetical protein